MFGKLLKYEFKSAGKWYLGLYAVIGILSVAIGFWIQSILLRGESGTNTYVSGSETEEIFFGITMIAFILIVFALLVSTFLMIAFRFKNNVYGREGYLTMTLPVTSHQILLSKYVAAIIWYVLAGVGIALAGVIIVGLAYLPIMAQLPYDLSYIIDGVIKEITYHDWLWLSILSLIVGTLVEFLRVYFAISLGQLFKDHRTLLAVVFYFGLGLVESLLSALIFLPIGRAYLIFNGPFEGDPSYFIITMIIDIVLGIGFYFGSHYILTKKLNLQ